MYSAAFCEVEEKIKYVFELWQLSNKLMNKIMLSPTTVKGSVIKFWLAVSLFPVSLLVTARKRQEHG